MDNIVKLPTRRTYMVEVTQGEGMFTAECDALHLVTEASTFEALTARMWELASDMIEANGLDVDVDSLRLHFNFEQSAHDIRLAMWVVGSGYYAQVRSILLEHGCIFVRQGKGSHEIWQSPITQCRFPVSVTVMSRNTANAIFKQAGLNVKIWAGDKDYYFPPNTGTEFCMACGAVQ